MTKAEMEDRIERINTELAETSQDVRSLRDRAVQLRKAGDVKGSQKMNQELSVFLSRREGLKSERLSLSANLADLSDSSSDSLTA